MYIKKFFLVYLVYLLSLFQKSSIEIFFGHKNIIFVANIDM